MEFFFFLLIIVPLGLASTAAYFIYKGMRKKYGKTASWIGTVLGFLVVLVGVSSLIASQIRIER